MLERKLLFIVVFFKRFYSICSKEESKLLYTINIYSLKKKISLQVIVFFSSSIGL
jgi:hypothetical protein